MKYPHSRLGKRHIRKSDLQRDLDEALHSLEAGIYATFQTAQDLRQINTDGYMKAAQSVFVTATGLYYKWDPTSVAPDDGVSVIRPSVGPASSGPGRWLRDTGGGGGSISVYDEGVLVMGGAVEFDFRGSGIQAVDGTSIAPSRVLVYVPPPAFLSHWNTADGSNGNQAVSESISRTTAHISTPSGGEGFPFRTNGWAATNQAATLNGVATFTTPAETTGFGGDSTMTVTVYNANGTSVLETFTTPPLTANGAYPSAGGRITVTLSLYGTDATRFKAKASVQVNVASVMSIMGGLSGGRVHVVVSHLPDSISDGSGPHIYTQTDVFLDVNPSTPSISGLVSIVETGGSIVTKHLSGIEYYTTNSQFTVDVAGIDNLNANTSRISGNLELNGSEYGLTALSQCPFGAGAGNFVGWTNVNNNTGASYHKTDWSISAVNYRYMAPTCNISSYDRDTWASGSTVLSADARVLIDTYPSGSTALAEYFDDEARREDPASFPGVGTWDSTATLGAGEAIVYNSQLAAPNTTTYVRSDGPLSPNADWTLYKPDLGGANPDYSLLGAPVDYGRRFTQAPGWIPSFSLVFSGTFAAGNMLADLVAGNVEIYVYRIGGLGHIGPPPGNTFPLRVHLPYNFALWDDGVTVAGSGIREGSSSGNTINCTFGAGTSANGGFYFHLRIVNPATKIDSVVCTFF